MANDLYGWGSNSIYGGVGNNSSANVSSPVLVMGSVDFFCTNGGLHNAALKSGNLYTWGRNTSGQLGINSVINVSSPTIVGSANNWVFANAGWNLGVIKSDGTLWMCGDNTFGSVGDGTTINRSSLVQIAGSWSVVRTESSFSPYHTVAIRSDGTLWGWGDNSIGQLGQNNLVSYSSPVQIGNANNYIDCAVACVGNAPPFNTCLTVALRSDGTLWVVGNGAYEGRTGTGVLTNYSSITQVGSSTNWAAISSTANTVGAIKKDGTLWMWGTGNNGALGTGDIVSRSSPTQIGSGNDWAEIQCNYYNGLARKTNGTIWSWGLAANGVLGNGTVTRSSPLQIGTSSETWALIGGGYYTSFAIRVPNATITPSPTASVTVSPTVTPSPTPSPTPSSSPSPTPSESPSPTPSESPSPTPSPTPSESPSPTPSDTPSPTPSESPTPTPTPSDSPMPTAMPIPSLSPTATPGPISYYYYTLIDCGETYNKVGRTTKTPAQIVATPNWFVGPNLCFVVVGYATGPAYDYDLDASTSAPINGCTDPLCSPPVIAITASTNFVTSTLLPNADGYDFYNQGTGAGSLALTFQNASSSAQAVFVSLFNQSNQTMIVSVNGVSYPVYAGQSFSQTITLKAGNYISISSVAPSLYTSATVYGQIYVARPSQCAYIANLTPATRAVEGDEGSLDTSVVNGVSQQRNAYITITENGDQVKVIETSVYDDNCFNTNIQGLPDVIPLLASGFPQF